jgi:hypothetical protein
MAQYRDPVPLDHPVYPVVKPSEDCVGDPLLEQLVCRDGPVPGQISEKRHNLLTGSAWEKQTVAFIVERVTDRPLALAMVRLDGHPAAGTFAEAASNAVSRSPYIGMVMRDDRLKNRCLPGTTIRLGTVALHAILEVIVRDRPRVTPREVQRTWAWIDQENEPSFGAFGGVGFRKHIYDGVPFDQSASGLFVPRARDILVVRSVRPLPDDLPSSAYTPVLPDAPSAQAA